MLEKNPTLALSPPEPKQSEGHQAVGDAIHQYQICNIPHLYLKSIESPICNGEHHESFTWPKPYNGCDPCSRASSMWPSATFLEPTKIHPEEKPKVVVHPRIPPHQETPFKALQLCYATNDIVILLFLKIVRIDV